MLCDKLCNLRETTNFVLEADTGDYYYYSSENQAADLNPFQQAGINNCPFIWFVCKTWMTTSIKKTKFNSQNQMINLILSSSEATLVWYWELLVKTWFSPLIFKIDVWNFLSTFPLLYSIFRYKTYMALSLLLFFTTYLLNL